MRIAIDIRKIGKKSTGDEVVFYHLVKELTRLKESKKHNFLLLTDQNVLKISRVLGKIPANFRICKVAPTAKLFWTFYSLPRFLKKNPVDLLHVEYIVPFHLSKKIRIITTIHDISFRINPGWISKKDSFLLNNFIPLSLKRANAVITVSDFSKEEINKHFGYSRERIFVTYPAIDKRIFNDKKRFGANKEIEKIIGGKYPYILHISSLQPRKNVPLVIRAYAQAMADWEKEDSSWKDTKLVLVGNKKGYNYDRKIEEEIQNQVTVGRIKTGSIIMPGFLPTNLLPALYREALIFVFPSSYEGFGIPLLEAMSCKTPVIASNIGTFKEVAGNAAIFLDIERKDNESLLKKAIKSLIEDKRLRDKQIKLGLERIKIFDWAELAKKTLDVYKEVLK